MRVKYGKWAYKYTQNHNPTLKFVFVLEQLFTQFLSLHH